MNSCQEVLLHVNKYKSTQHPFISTFHFSLQKKTCIFKNAEKYHKVWFSYCTTKAGAQIENIVSHSRGSLKKYSGIALDDSFKCKSFRFRIIFWRKRIHGDSENGSEDAWNNEGLRSPALISLKEKQIVAEKIKFCVRSLSIQSYKKKRNIKSARSAFHSFLHSSFRAVQCTNLLAFVVTATPIIYGREREREIQRGIEGNQNGSIDSTIKLNCIFTWKVFEELILHLYYLSVHPLLLVFL